MRVGWLADQAGYVGGAELTAAEFRAAAPEGVEIVDCPAGAVVPGLDRYALHNCVTYSPADIDAATANAPAVKYWNDVGSWYSEDVRALLNKHARAVCCSPLQAEYMGLGDAVVIPPPVDLARFETAAANSNGNRSGAVSVASWRNLGKAPDRVAEWAAKNGGIDFYGSGAFAPGGSRQIAYEGMPALLARYRTFVFMPDVIEPFGRVVAEAWAAGCKLIISEFVGARYWIEENPEGLRTAAEDFWKLVLS